ncbi:MAG: NADPH-dependent FMN reductase [Flavobacteriaceae bacterium]
MKKIAAFAGSNSKNSINKQLVHYAASLFENVNVDILDLNDFELPLFGVDLEKESGIPENAHRFFERIKAADGVLLSLAEHNGAYTAAFKNLFDWVSRIEVKWFYDNPVMLMATAPGGRGGLSVLELAQNRFPRHNAHIVNVFSLPFFKDNFKDGKLVNPDYDLQLKQAIKQFEKTITDGNTTHR